MINLTVSINTKVYKGCIDREYGCVSDSVAVRKMIDVISFGFLHGALGASELSANVDDIIKLLFGVLFFGSLLIVLYLRYHIKKNFSIAKIVSIPIMSIYLVFCGMFALSASYFLVYLYTFEKLSQSNGGILGLIIKLIPFILLFIGVYVLLSYPIYRVWKKSLTTWVGSNPEEEIDALEEKISSLMKKIDINRDERDTLSSISMKVDVMYYKQKLDSLVKSKRTARFMNIFVIVCPIALLALEIILILGGD